MRESGNRSPGATAELSARVKRDQAGDEIVQDRVRRVRGVREVENQLEVYEQTSGVSSLRRLVSGAVGAAAAIAGLRRRGSLGRLLTVFGLGMLARALLDRSIHGGWNQGQSDRTDWPLSATDSTV